MSSSHSTSTRAQLLHRLRERLEAVNLLNVEMHRSLKEGDAAAIHDASSRLETLLLEFKLLHGEYQRLPEPAVGDRAFDNARKQLEISAIQLARSTAIGGGLLERLIHMSRMLIGAIASSASSGDAYDPTGKTPELTGDGLRLRETV